MAVTRAGSPVVTDLFPEQRCFDVEAYNFEHFRLKHLWFDAKQTAARRGLAPGTVAPDFEMPRVGGGTRRLSQLRDKPVLLHFGSFT